MIMKWYYPGTKLAVGKPEYKQIIEECLVSISSLVSLYFWATLIASFCVEFFQKIPCVHGPAVMELMWGIQNCMPSLVPREKTKLTEADRLPISQGLHAVLSRYDCVVKAEMVS
jgi:nucleolar protein 58